MRKICLALLLPVFAITVLGAEPPPVRPFEATGGFVPKNAIDKAVLLELTKKGIPPARPCSDEVFVRRVYLDLTGTLPSPKAVVSFLRDPRPDRRDRLVDSLLDSPGYVDYQTLRWCDLLRVKSEFPINLWPNAVQAYQRFVHDAIRKDRPFDQVARDLLTSSGSNNRVPAVNFYRAVDSRTPSGLAETVALTFMGCRISDWSADKQAGLAKFFSRVEYKRTREWKEEIVCLDPKPAPAMTAELPDGTKVRIGAEQDPREVFANWLLTPGNPWFARALANRVWAWLMGRGVVQEPDDIRPDNPPSNPALLAVLARDLTASHFDLKALYREIADSATYQQSSIPAKAGPETDALFAHYIVRQLDAEVLMDALCRITGTTVTYWSRTPEPYTFIPDDHPTISLADGSITSPFLEMFGRPARDTGLMSERSNDPTDGQRLYFLNSTDVLHRIAASSRLRALLRRSRGNMRSLVDRIYLLVLSRHPTKGEVATALAYERTGGVRGYQAAVDVMWALLNSKEFLYRH